MAQPHTYGFNTQIYMEDSKLNHLLLTCIVKCNAWRNNLGRTCIKLHYGTHLRIKQVPGTLYQENDLFFQNGSSLILMEATILKFISPMMWQKCDSFNLTFFKHSFHIVLYSKEINMSFDRQLTLVCVIIKSLYANEAVSSQVTHVTSKIGG